jgi:hypothetical protein
MRREYRMSVGNALYLAGFCLVWFGAIVVFVIGGQLPHGWKPSYVAAIAAALLFALAPTLIIAFIPYHVTLTDLGELEFRSILRRRWLRAQQIKALEWDEDSIYLVYDGGKVRILADEKFKDLLARILELNPAIEADDESRRLIGARS